MTIPSAIKPQQPQQPPSTPTMDPNKRPDPLLDIAKMRAAAQGINPPSGNNAPSTPTTQMSTQQQPGGGPLSNVSSTGRQNFGQGPSASQIAAGNVGGNIPLGGVQNAPPTNPASGVTTSTTPQAAAMMPPPVGQGAAQVAGQRIGNMARSAKSAAIESLYQEQQQQMQAAKDEYAAQRARDQLNAASRSGLGGFGLSGASATMQADVGRADTRNETLGLGQLASQQANDRFRQTQQTALIGDLEATENRDIDGDGKVNGVPVSKYTGDGNPDDWNKEADDANKPKTAPGPKPEAGAGITPSGQASVGSGPAKPAPKDTSGYQQVDSAFFMPWDIYDGEDANYVYVTVGRDGLGVKKGEKIAIKKHQ